MHFSSLPWPSSTPFTWHRLKQSPARLAPREEMADGVGGGSKSQQTGRWAWQGAETSWDSNLTSVIINVPQHHCNKYVIFFLNIPEKKTTYQIWKQLQEKKRGGYTNTMIHRNKAKVRTCHIKSRASDHVYFPVTPILLLQPLTWLRVINENSVRNT